MAEPAPAYNSCPHAIAYAARHPQRVRRMVLCLIEQDWDLFADSAAYQWLGWSAAEAGRAASPVRRGGA